VAKKDSAHEQQNLCAICKNAINIKSNEKYITDGTVVYHFCCYLSMINKDKIDSLFKEQERVSENYYNMEEIVRKEMKKVEEAERNVRWYNSKLQDIQQELDAIQSELCALRGIPQDE
jgi:hypothetical protein